MSPVGSSSCPYCNQDVILEVPLPFGQTVCSHCDERVWFVTIGSVRSFFRYEAAGLVRQLFHGLRDGQRLPRELRFDALDEMELVMDFEDALEEAS